jgi:hypothetical protein
MDTLVPQYGPNVSTVDPPSPSVKMPLGGSISMPGADTDQDVGPVMAEPPFVIVNCTSPVFFTQAPSTLMLDLSQVGVPVTVGVNVGSGVLVGVGVLVTSGVLVGVGVGRLAQEPTVLKVTEERNDVR